MPAIFLFHEYRSNEKDLFPLVKSLRDTHHSLGAHITFKSYSSDHYVSPENKRDLIKFIKGT